VKTPTSKTAYINAVQGITLASAVYDRLKADILQGRFTPDQKLKIEELSSFYGCKVSDCWQGIHGISTSGKPGDTHTALMIINHAIPLLWFLYRITDDQRIQQRVFNLLKQLPPEQNHITEIFKQEGIKSRSAFQSQGLIHLYKNLCTKHLCNQCYVYQEKTECLNQLEELGVLYH
jgi:hypothetical protein